VLGILSVPDAISAQAEVDQPLPRYYPFRPGILPSDLGSEIAMVQREVQFIFNEALSEWRALPLPTLAGNPPILRGSGYEAVEILGKLLNFDSNMSPFRNEACGFCHMPYVAFSGPIPSVTLTMVASNEMAGYDLFKGKGNCNSCHLDGRSTTLTPDQTDTGAAANTRPLFTCFGYANLACRSIPG